MLVLCMEKAVVQCYWVISVVLVLRTTSFSVHIQCLLVLTALMHEMSACIVNGNDLSYGLVMEKVHLLIGY